jgi:glycosidase
MTDQRAAFAKVNWLAAMNIYEVNLRQYTPEGNFAAFQKHIPRLKEMGVDVLWLMPIQPIGLINRKGSLGSYYAIQDYTGVNPEFGSLSDFQSLVKTVHQNEMKLIIDWVANHSSWDHHWVQENPGFYARDDNGNMFAPNDWDDVVQFDHSNTAQQNAMASAMEYWVQETGIDGFRCDMAHLTPLHFWEKARRQCEQHKKLFWLAETQDEPYFDVFDAIYGWEWLHKMADYYKGQTNLNGLETTIQLYFTGFQKNQFRILFTSNHDENSWQDTEYKRLGDSARVFAAICACLPGIPLVYSGQEEPLLRKLSFFDKDTIAFEKYELAPFYQSLLHLKKNNPAMATDANCDYFRLKTTDNNTVFAFIKQKGNHAILLISNLSRDDSFRFAITDTALNGKFRNIKNGLETDFSVQKTFTLKPWEFEIYEK